MHRRRLGVLLMVWAIVLIGSAVAHATSTRDTISTRDTTVKLASSSPSAGRSYILHISGSSPRPLVVVLHGWRLSVADVQKQTGFSQYGDGHGFDVAYAQSARRTDSWNAGGCCGGAKADDLTYLKQLVADARTRVAITQAYVVGFSNGGMMALRAVCASDTFAAAASVSGPLLVPCHRKVKALHLQGTFDRAVPLLGGYSTYTGSTFPNSLRQTATLTVRTFPSGHEWPKGATAEIWGFLAGRPRQGR